MRATIIISFLMFIFSANVWADLNIRYDSIRHNQKKPFNSILIKQGLVRINQSPAPQSSVMINLDSGDIVQLHPQSRRYFKINAHTLGQYVSIYQKNKSMFQGLIDHGLQRLNPQKRSQVQQLIKDYRQGSKSINNITIKPTRKADRVLGVECNVLAVFDQGQLQREVCISDYQQLGLTAADIKSLENLKTFITQFKQSASREQQELLASLTQGISHLKGIPLKIVNYQQNGQIKNIVQAGSISFKSIPDQAYRIPHDYQQQSFPIL